MGLKTMTELDRTKDVACIRQKVNLCNLSQLLYSGFPTHGLE